MPLIDVSGRIIDFPDTMSNDDIVRAIETDILPQFAEHEAKTGFIPAAKQAFQTGLGSIQVGAGSFADLLGMRKPAQEWTAAGVTRQQAADAMAEPTSEADIAQMQRDYGKLGELYGEARQEVMEPLGRFTGRVGPLVGSMMTGLGGVGLGAELLAQTGEMRERGVTPGIAAAAAVPLTAINLVGLPASPVTNLAGRAMGLGTLSEAGGQAIAKAITDRAEKVAAETTASGLASLAERGEASALKESMVRAQGAEAGIKAAEAEAAKYPMGRSTLQALGQTLAHTAGMAASNIPADIGAEALARHIAGQTQLTPSEMGDIAKQDLILSPFLGGLQAKLHDPVAARAEAAQQAAGEYSVRPEVREAVDAIPELQRQETIQATPFHPERTADQMWSDLKAHTNNPDAPEYADLAPEQQQMFTEALAARTPVKEQKDGTFKPTKNTVTAFDRIVKPAETDSVMQKVQAAYTAKNPDIAWEDLSPEAKDHAVIEFTSKGTDALYPDVKYGRANQITTQGMGRIQLIHGGQSFEDIVGKPNAQQEPETTQPDGVSGEQPESVEAPEPTPVGGEGIPESGQEPQPEAVAETGEETVTPEPVEEPTPEPTPEPVEEPVTPEPTSEPDYTVESLTDHIKSRYGKAAPQVSIRNSTPEERALNAVAHYDPKTKRVTLLVDRLTKDDDIHGLLLHEIGVHASKLGKSDTTFKAILDQFAALERQKNPAVLKALESVPADTPAHHRIEEGLGRLAEMNPNLPIVKRLMSWIRTTVHDLTGNAGWLKPEDVAYLANKALKRGGDFTGADTTGKSDILYSRKDRSGQKNPAKNRAHDISADRFERTPELVQGVQDLQEGRITREEYDRLVDEYRPVYPYEDVPHITTEEEARYALSHGKSQSEEKGAKYGLPSKTLKEGDIVQLRLDIPSYRNSNTWVVSVHTPNTKNEKVPSFFDAGHTVGYESVAAATNTRFGVMQTPAVKIAVKNPKATIATVVGNWKPITPEAARDQVKAALKDPAWTQVGMDPFRHGYFYDRDTMRPVLSSDEVIQIGPLVMAKNAKFGTDVDTTGTEFRYSRRSPEVESLLKSNYTTMRDDIPTKDKRSWFEKTWTKYIDKGYGLTKALAPHLSEQVGSKLRADLLYRHVAQIWNVINAGRLTGVPQLEKDGTTGLKTVSYTLHNGKKVDASLAEMQRVADTVPDGRKLVSEIAYILDTRGQLNRDASKVGKHITGDMETFRRREAEAAKVLKEHPELQDVLNMWRKINHGLIDYSYNTGLIDAKTRDIFKRDPNYMPRYTLREEVMSATGADDPKGRRGGYTADNHYVKTFRERTASEHETNPWENMARHYASVTLGGSNNVAKRAAAEQLMMAQQAAGITDTISLTKTGGNFAVLEDGKRKFYKLDDPNMVPAMMAVQQELGSLVKLGRGATRVLRAGVLNTPAYWARQIVRDPIYASMVSDVGWITPAHTMHELARIREGKSAEYDLLKKRGVVSHVDPIMSPADASAFAKDIGKTKVEKGVVGKAAGKAGTALENVHAAIDGATRVAVYKAALKKAFKQGKRGEDAINYAVMKARESLNFSVRGSSTGMETARALIPFLSATLQGLETFRRAAMGTNVPLAQRAAARRSFAAKAATISMLTAGYALMMMEDEKYNDYSDIHTKYGSFLVPTGDDKHPFTPIPLAPEVALFKWPIEMIINYAYGQETGSDLAKAVLGELGALTPSVIPQGVRPALELMTNYSFHTGEPIESVGERGYAVKERGRHTSEGAKLLADNPVAEALGMSPSKIDYLARSVAGDAGRAALGLMGMALGNEPDKPVDWAKLPVIGAGSFVSPAYGSRARDDFYDAKAEADQARQTFNMLKETEPESQKFKDYANDREFMRKVSMAKVYDRLAKKISELSKREAMIMNNPNLSVEAKEQRSAEIRNQINDITRNFMKRQKETAQ